MDAFRIHELSSVLASSIGSGLSLAGVSGDLASWYVTPLLAPYALLLRLVTRAARRRWPTARRSAAAAAALVAVLIVSHVARSDPVHGYPGWRSVSGHTVRFLRAFDAALAGARPGDVVHVEGLPLGAGAPIERVGIRSALGLADYSVAAYAELAFPGRAVRIVLPDEPDPPPTSGDAVTVRVTLLPPGETEQ